MLDKLKPCPFCGAGYIEILQQPCDCIPESDMLYKVVCTSCTATMDRMQPTIDAAIAAWNRRAEVKDDE